MSLAAISGMNRHTGKACTGYDHVRQSIDDILTTSIGERVLNRLYGSDLPDHIDGPIGDTLVQSLFAATAIAIATWYPVVTLSRIRIEQGQDRSALNILAEGEEHPGNGSALPFTIAIPFFLSSPNLN